MSGYVVLPGASGDYVTSPDHASFDITGDLEIVCCVALDSWTLTTSQQVQLFARWTGGQETFEFGLVESGGSVYPRLAWYNNTPAFNFETIFTNIGVPADGEHMWFKSTLDVDNGASGYTVRAYKSTDAIDTAPGSVSWTEIGTGATSAGVTNIRATAGKMELGSINDGVSRRWAGKYYYANAKNGIGGTVVVNPDFRDGDQTSDGGATFVDDQGRTWTLNGNTSWVSNVVKATGRTIDMNFETRVVTVQSGV